MSQRILIAGAGHGGLVAARYLAEAGCDVTVLECRKREALGYDQTDSVHLDGFEESGVPVPEEYLVKRTPLSFILPGEGVPPITQGVHEDEYNVEIDRRALYDLLIGMAESAGAKLRCGVRVLGPIMLGSRVAGVKTDAGDEYADLVIDAAGLYSPVRQGLPEYLGIEREPGPGNVLHAYRAYFDRAPGVEAPELKYQVFLIPGENCGLMWAITHDNEVDVLVGTFVQLDEAMLRQRLSALRELNPQIGENLLRGGAVSDIPLRQPLSLLVADGYAAVGDSAFMTIPLKGSGVGYSMRAGRMLAEAVLSDDEGRYTAETLWDYQVSFYERIGFDAGLLALIKELMPLITAEDIEYVIHSGLVTPEILRGFGNEEGLLKILTSGGLGGLRDKARKIVGHQNVRRMLLFTAKNAAKYAFLRQNLKARYDSRSAEKWVRAAARFYGGLKKPESDPAAEERSDE